MCQRSRNDSAHVGRDDVGTALPGRGLNRERPRDMRPQRPEHFDFGGFESVARGPPDHQRAAAVFAAPGEQTGLESRGVAEELAERRRIGGVASEMAHREVGGRRSRGLRKERVDLPPLRVVGVDQFLGEPAGCGNLPAGCDARRRQQHRCRRAHQISDAAKRLWPREAVQGRRIDSVDHVENRAVFQVNPSGATLNATSY